MNTPLIPTRVLDLFDDLAIAQVIELATMKQEDVELAVLVGALDTEYIAPILKHGVNLPRFTRGYGDLLSLNHKERATSDWSARSLNVFHKVEAAKTKIERVMTEINDREAGDMWTNGTLVSIDLEDSAVHSENPFPQIDHEIDDWNCYLSDQMEDDLWADA